MGSMLGLTLSVMYTTDVVNVISSSAAVFRCTNTPTTDKYTAAVH